MSWRSAVSPVSYVQLLLRGGLRAARYCFHPGCFRFRRWGASQKKARRADLARARKRPKVIPQHLLAPRVSLSPTYYVNVLPHVMNGRTIHTVATVQHDRFI